jgi:glycosyltransferase involved in cell wall biosynthesis
VGWYRWWLLRLHRRFQFQILHSHGTYPTGYLAARCSHWLDAPILITSHGGDIDPGGTRQGKPIVQARLRQAVAGADVLVSISRFTRDCFIHWGAREDQFAHIPNGVNLPTFASRVPRPSDLDPAIVPGSYVLFLGRLSPRKGTDLLLRALEQIPAHGKVQLVIAGAGNELPHLQQIATEAGLQDRVRFVGAAFGETKTYLLQNALLTAMPSRHSEAARVSLVCKILSSQTRLAGWSPQNRRQRLPRYWLLFFGNPLSVVV